MGRIFRTFLAGVLALLPIAVTVFVVAWVASFIASYAGPDSFIGRLIIRLGASVGLDVTPGSIAAYLLGLAIFLGLIFVLGLFVESGLRSFFVNAVDWMKLMNVYVSMGVTPPQSMPPGAKPALANRNRAKSLSREPEMQHVAVLDDVVLALET